MAWKDAIERKTSLKDPLGLLESGPGYEELSMVALPVEVQKMHLQAIQVPFRVATAIENMIIDCYFKDFKEVTEKAMGALFTLNQDGKVVGIKDAEALSWFQQCQMPRVALYKYAQTHLRR